LIGSPVAASPLPKPHAIAAPVAAAVVSLAAAGVVSLAAAVDGLDASSEPHAEMVSAVAIATAPHARRR
jgi:hypothetical protein